MKKLNNKGYMLIEIILAFAIAMGITYFMFELIIKIKNKNDDLLVKTLVSTDQAIIYNTVMKDLYQNSNVFSCNKIKIEDNKFLYNDNVVSILSEYAFFGEVKCGMSSDVLSIEIPIKVNQLKDNFNVVINYSASKLDSVSPVCSLSVSSDNKITATYSDNIDGGGILYYGWNSSYSGDKSSSKTINSVGTYTYYVMDNQNNKGQCSVIVQEALSRHNCRTAASKSISSCNYIPSVRVYASNRLCENACSGVCVAEECKYCPAGGTYSAGICVKDCVNFNCPSGWGLSDSYCYLSNQVSCPVGTYYSSTYSCASSGFVNTADNNFCYKIIND